MIVSCIAGISFTAGADTAYGDYLVVGSDTEDTLPDKVVRFNGCDWYIIADNSTAVDAGAVTLLSKDSLGSSKFNDDDTDGNYYSSSDVKTIVDSLTAENEDFAGVADAIKTVSFTVNGYQSSETYDTVNNVKLYLLSTAEASALPADLRKFSALWWLCSPGEEANKAAVVQGTTGNVSAYGSVVSQYSNSIRPALQLDLSKVIFDPEDRTFSLAPDPVPYLAWDGEKLAEQTADSYNILKSTEGSVEASGWVVVEGDVEVRGGLCLVGPLNIILCDGATLTLGGFDAYNFGDLNIYSQSTGDEMGTLTVDVSDYDGYNAIYAGGNITINGGNINATGTNGINNIYGNVTVNGGNLNIVGDNIGIGTDGYTVTINGGNISATGNNYCGILANNASAVVINGGNIETTGKLFGIVGTSSLTVSNADIYAAGETYGICAYNGDLTVNSGTVIARGDTGIFAKGTVTINGDEVTATGNTKAVSGTLKNAVPGTAWTDPEGTEGKTAVETSTTGQTLSDTYKKAHFREAYSVTYEHGENATGDSYEDKTVETSYELLSSLPDGWVVDDGYLFYGWTNGDETFDLGEEVTIEEDSTFTAVWVAYPPYTVSPEGAGTVEVTGDPDEGYTYTATAGDDYKFVSWIASYTGGSSESTSNNTYTVGAEDIEGLESLIALFEIITYKVTYKPGTGAVGDEFVDTSEGAAYNLLNTVPDGWIVKPDYTLKYWKIGNETYGLNAAIELTGDITATAVWQKKVAPIPPEPEPVPAPATAVYLELDPTEITLREGESSYISATARDWLGYPVNVTWTCDNDDVVLVAEGLLYASSEGTARIIATAGGLYAECLVTVVKTDPEKYTIIFDTDGGSDIAPITGLAGSAVTAPEAPTKRGYTFIGWDQEIPATIPAKNITIKATWKIKQYTIKFMDGNTVISASALDYDAPITVPDPPKKEDSVFSGWDMIIPSAMPSGNLEISAIYVPIAELIIIPQDTGKNNTSTAIAGETTPVPVEVPETTVDKKTITGVQNDHNGMDLSWDKMPEASGYQLSVQVDGKYVPVVNLGNVTNAEVILGTNGKYYVSTGGKYAIFTYDKNNGKFKKTGTLSKDKIDTVNVKNNVTTKFMVSATDSSGKVFAEEDAYKINVKVYYKPVVKAALQKGKVTLKWAKVQGATKYGVYKYVNGKLKLVAETNKLSAVISGLKAGYEYTYAVKAFVDGEWTSVTANDLVKVKGK